MLKRIAEIGPDKVQGNFLKKQDVLRKRNARIMSLDISFMHPEVQRVFKEFHEGKDFKQIAAGELVPRKKGESPAVKTPSHILYAIGMLHTQSRSLSQDEITPEHFRLLSRSSGLIFTRKEFEVLSAFHKSLRPQAKDVAAQLAPHHSTSSKEMANENFTSKRTVDYHLANASAKLKAAGYPHNYVTAMRRYVEYDTIRRKLIKTGRLTPSRNSQRLKVIGEFWGNGLTAEQIGEKLHIDPSSVQAHVYETRGLLKAYAHARRKRASE